MNGSAAIAGNRGRFASAIARPALLFGGTAPATSTPNVTILNETVPATQADALSGVVGKIGAYYRDYIGRPIADRPTFLRMVTIDQVERDRKKQEWGFATWPTIALSGSVGAVGQALLAGGNAAANRTGYIAHEMGHYYFGTLTSPRGPYRWLLLESTAEFLATKALRAVAGDSAADKRIAALAANVATQKQPFVALDRIADGAQIDPAYRYAYAPLLLVALERRVGADRMQRFMRGLLATPEIQTWADLQAVAANAGIDAAAWQGWRDACVADGRATCAEPTR